MTLPEFNGALDRWLDPPCESGLDALRIEQAEEAFFAEVRGERCELCGGKTRADVDDGKGWVLCLDESCEHQRTEAI